MVYITCSLARHTLPLLYRLQVGLLLHVAALDTLDHWWWCFQELSLLLSFQG